MKIPPSLVMLVAVVFLIGAVFGFSFLMFEPMGHGMGCPFAAGTALCPAPLTHLAHWQAAFAAVLAELILLAALAPSLFSGPDFSPSPPRRRKRWEVSASDAPTLLQELFAQGILNRKAP